MPAGRCASTAVCAAGAARRASQAGGAGGGAQSFKVQPAKAPSPAPMEEKKEPEEPKSLPRRCVGGILDFLDQTWLQTLQYIVFLITFQSLTMTIRKPEEFYFDKYLSDTFINNPFDADHNRFGDIRRIADIWEWQKNVLAPGLFGQSFQGEYWPDGDGMYGIDGATPMSVDDWVELTNVVSFAEGVVFKQSRAEAIPEGDRACFANHTCFGTGEGCDLNGNGGDTAPFGHGACCEDQFVWWSAEDLGAASTGVNSASPLSYRTFPSSGYVAAFMPFFSADLLPDQTATWQLREAVADHRLNESTPSNGKPPNYFCARTTFNGHHMKQGCNADPAASSFVTRDLFDETVETLKRGHWIDHRTRLFSITMQMRNNHAGVRFVARYMFEITQMGAVLPSYDMETLIDDADNNASQGLWMMIAFALTMWFAMLEGVELLQSGPVEYFTNAWNVMDWGNFIIFFMVYIQLHQTRWLDERDKSGTNCVAKFCTEFGYYDYHEVFSVGRNAKLLMSICVCIQLLKIIKFTNVIVPKMSLMTRVLSKGCYDLLFFSIIFGVSMFAFCMLFYIQLGSFMDDFYSQPSSLIALAKALFGDFPFEEIMDNSRGYTNGILFLVYLFVAVFILLSMFLAILGEAQAAVRDEEMRLKEAGDFPNQYGFLGEARDFVTQKFAQLRGGKDGDGEEGADGEEGEEGEGKSGDMPGLDAALNAALVKMQRKLDASVATRMQSLSSSASSPSCPASRRARSRRRRAAPAAAAAATAVCSSRSRRRRGAARHAATALAAATAARAAAAATAATAASACARRAPRG